MGLKEVLSKMRIVEIDPDEAAAAAPPVPGMSLPGGPGGPAPKGPPAPPKDIRDLLGDIPEPPVIDERKLPAESADEGAEIPDFPAIYRAAGVTDPAHGYSAYKVLEIFASPSLVGCWSSIM